MKRFALLLIAIFTLSGQVFAQPATLEKSLLWEVTGNGLATPSYVFGTIHMINKADFFLTDATLDAMSEAEQFTFEIDMEDMSDMTKMMPLLMQAFMRGDTTLSDLLTDEEYQIVSDHFKEIGLPLMFLERIKPMFLSALTGEEMMSMQGREEQESSIVSYEMEIMKTAQANRKPIEGLETAEFQMSMFDSIPYRVQAKMLVESINANADTVADKQMEEMVRMYKDQDIDAMVTMMDDEGGIGGYEDLLLVNRNKKWIPIMEEMMQDKTTFFAVGAGHLGGKYGVIRLLKEAGYTLKPLY